MSRVRFRPNLAVPVAAVVALIGAVPLAVSAWYLLPVLLVPLAVLVWALRSGTVVDRDGIEARALLGARRVPWSDVAALVPSGRRVAARLTSGATLALPSVTPSGLPAIVAIGKPRSEADPEPPFAADPEPNPGHEPEPSPAERDGAPSDEPNTQPGTGSGSAPSMAAKAEAEAG